MPANVAASVSANLSTVEEYMKGDSTAEIYGQFTGIGVTAVQIIDANTDRKGFHIQATSTNTNPIFLGCDNLVTATKHFVKLDANDCFQMERYQGQIYAISDAAAQKIQYVEY